MALVADMVRAAQAAALARQYQQPSTPGGETPSAPSPSSDQAVIADISTAGFSSELEKHLTDYRKGRAEMSKKTSGKLQKLDETNASLLQQLSPRALTQYGLYGTFMNYETRSRYVANVYSAARETASITRTLTEA